MSSKFSIGGECAVCKNELEITVFRVLPCGHCYCEECVKTLCGEDDRDRQKCPLCRSFWRYSQVRKLGFSPVLIDPMDGVVDGLDRMDKDCKAISVKDAYEGLTHASKALEGSNAERLFRAIEDFSERIVPLFEDVEEGRDRIKLLEQANDNISSNLVAKTLRVERLEKDTRELRKSKVAAEKKFVEAVETAEVLQGKVDELQRNLSDVKRILVEKEQEYRRVKDMLERQKSAADSREKKMKMLKAQVADLNTKLQEKENLATAVQSSLMDVDQDDLMIGTPSRLCMRPSSPTALRPFPADDWVDIGNFQFEAMPRPGFHSDWNISGKKTSSTLRKPPASSKDHSRFPLNLDAKGRPTIAVQLGPKSTIRVGQPS